LVLLMLSPILIITNEVILESKRLGFIIGLGISMLIPGGNVVLLVRIIAGIIKQKKFEFDFTETFINRVFGKS